MYVICTLNFSSVCRWWGVTILRSYAEASRDGVERSVSPKLYVYDIYIHNMYTIYICIYIYIYKYMHTATRDGVERCVSPNL